MPDSHAENNAALRSQGATVAQRSYRFFGVVIAELYSARTNSRPGDSEALAGGAEFVSPSKVEQAPFSLWESSVQEDRFEVGFSFLHRMVAVSQSLALEPLRAVFGMRDEDAPPERSFILLDGCPLLLAAVSERQIWLGRSSASSSSGTRRL